MSRCGRVIAPFLAALALAACSTTERNKPRYAWETAQEPEYRQVFRGRWWNYYDRGLWNQLRGNYAEAEEDLRTALNLRAADQLWPRTYGMHFLPEYFPKRELGITLLHAKKFDQAASLLEESINERYSARASYYLDDARGRILLASGADVESPEFVLLSPDPNAPSGEMFTQLRGVATDDHYVDKVLVNGKPFDVPVSASSIDVTYDIELTGENNTIEVEVIDLLGNSTVNRYEIAADHTGPLISFDAYEAATRTIRGVVYDARGVASFEIGGLQFPIDASEGNVQAFEFAAGADELANGIPYRSMDVSGNATAGLLTEQTLRAAFGEPVAGPVRVAMNAEDEDVRVFLAQAQTAQSVFKAAMVNIGDEQRFYTDSITVDFEVISREPIREVTFNGDALDIIPARSSFVVSRAFPLFNEPARFDLRLEAENERGETAVDEKVIYRELNEVELDVSKLSMVFVQPENQHPDIDEAGVTQILNWLQDSGPYRNRFARAKVRLDSVLDAMLDEYELMALEEGEEQLDRSQERIADLIITTLIKGGEDFVEIIMRGYSVDQQVEITDRVEVADGFEDGVTLDKLRPLVETLATRLVQEFPRVQAPVYDVRGARVAFGLTSDDGIREFYKCLLVQRTTETVGDFVSETYETQGIGFCEVPRSQNFSWGTFTWAGSFAEGASDTDLGEYTVVTK